MNTINIKTVEDADEKTAITLKRCILSPLSETDFYELIPLLTNAEVRKYLGGIRPVDALFQSLRKSMGTANEYPFTVRLQKTNDFIGLVTIAPHHDPVDMEISYMFLPEHWGNGYAKETVSALLRFCNQKLHLSRVVSETQAANIRSCQLLESLGYYEGKHIVRYGAQQVIYIYDFTKPQPQSWPDCDKTIFQYVTGFVDILKNKLINNLTGVYLHGSLAMGSYFPPKSDMDFIIVADNPLDADRAKELNQSIAQYAETSPTVGSIECSVITLDTARNVPDEMPYELHYSEMWHQRILNDQVSYGVRQTDPDLPAHLLCVKKRGVCLYGMKINEVFGDVSWRDFLLAVLEDFDWIVADENIFESPYYGVLNTCRVLQALTENNQKYLSKYEGAVWGLENLPEPYTPLIEKALAVYCSDTPIEEKERKTGGVTWDRSALLAFRDYAVRERDSLWKKV